MRGQENILRSGSLDKNVTLYDLRPSCSPRDYTQEQFVFALLKLKRPFLFSLLPLVRSFPVAAIAKWTLARYPVASICTVFEKKKSRTFTICSTRHAINRDLGGSMDRDVISNRWIRQDLQSPIFDSILKRDIRSREKNIISSNLSLIGWLVSRNRLIYRDLTDNIMHRFSIN